MTEINVAMEQMYETEMHERESREKQPAINKRMVIAAALVAGIGFLMPSPANWYVWIVGGIGVIMLKEIVWR